MEHTHLRLQRSRAKRGGTIISQQNTYPLQSEFPHCIVKVSCIATKIIQIPTIYSLIKFLLHINVHYDIILTWEVHQEVGQCQLII